MEHIERFITSLVLWLKLGAEVVSVVLVSIGIVSALAKLLRIDPSTREKRYHQMRLGLGRFLVLGLEFQLAADILGTAVAPTWDHLGRLGAIAGIRTFLNYFLQREIREEESEWKTLKAEVADKK